MPNRSDLARIHIAKRELGLDDTTYHGILWDRYHQDSAADLTPDQAADLLELFREKGWRPASAGQRALIHVLWQKLQKEGVIHHGDDRALDAFISHHTGHGDLRHLNVHDASRVIEMLKKWIERENLQEQPH